MSISLARSHLSSTEATFEVSRSKVSSLGFRRWDSAHWTAAQEAGAVGCLIFTDPGDDGEITEAHGYAQYPDGPARQVSAGFLIQAGHILTS